jgi:TonB-linked SusC/RagA family outer membrane protein
VLYILAGISQFILNHLNQGIKAMSIPFKRCELFLLLGTFFLIFMSNVSLAQQRTVTGTVTGSRDDLPLPGANVVVQGTTTGVITDLDGNYSLGILEGDVSIQFSFIGYTPQVIPVGNSTIINVIMTPSLSAIDEVVITSLGITRAKKRITYSAQNVEADNLAQARELNVASSLQGKVAGLDVIKSSSGVGSASRVIIRGNRSIAGNNQPLYIVDGVPIINKSRGRTADDQFVNIQEFSDGPDSEDGGVQYQDGISNLNPDDIETITVLKGPNANALYGARANNGAVVITTRKGKARQGIGVEFNTNVAMDKAMILTKFQHEYGQGYGGVYIGNSQEGWGARMDGQMVDHWSPDSEWAGIQYAYSPHNNFEEFFQTGLNVANTLTLTGGNEKARSIFSYTNTVAKGIVESNKLMRHNVNIRVDGNLTDKFSFDIKLTYLNQAVDNRLSNGDDFNNPMRAIYRQPSNISLVEAKRFEYFDAAGTRLQNSWDPGTPGGSNVYWILNRTIRKENRNRVIGMGSLRYQFTEGLSLMVRSSFDQIFDKESYKQYNDTYSIADDGNFRLINQGYTELNNDFILNYKNSIGEIFSMDVSFGGNILYQKNEALNTRTDRLLKPNLFVIDNTDHILSNQDGSERRVNSLYGFATFGIKNFLFLDLTGRNDWSSTLPKESWSYFYPSIGLTWVITDMLTSIPSFMTFAKVRANYAEVGNDTDPYAINKTYIFGPGGNHGYIHRKGILPAENLEPEKTRSIELGFDVKLFHNRLGIDFTWYKSNTLNQLLLVPMPDPSGYRERFINAGNMQNQGVEIIVNVAPVRMGDFSWDIMANYARNESLCIELTDELDEYTTRGKSRMTTHKIVEGEPFDQIYTKGFKRNEAGRILINDMGLPITSRGQTMPMGHSNPDWIGGLSNIFSFKRISLSILIDTRMGGDVFSFTEANLAGDGFSEATLEGRDGFVVNGVLESDGSENTIEVTAEEYWHSLGGWHGSIGELYRYDASYVRVREVLLGYSFRLNSTVIQGIDLALYGRNLGFLYNASEIIDPGMSLGIGNSQGVEGFGLPTSRTFGFNARFRF